MKSNEIYAYSEGLNVAKESYFERLSEEFESLEYDEDVEIAILGYCEAINTATEQLSNAIFKIRKAKRAQTNVVQINEFKQK